MSNQIKKGALISYFAIFINIVIALLYTPWMIRQIGISDYGLYSLVIAFISYFILDFGLGEAIARFLSLALARNNKEEISRIVDTSMRIYIVIDLVILLVLTGLYIFLNDIFYRFSSEQLENFRVIYCIAGLFSIISFPFMPLNGILISAERFIFLKGCDLLQKILTVILIITALFLGYGLFMLVFITGLTGFICSLVKYRYVKRILKLNFSITKFDIPTARSITKFSVWVFIISIAHRLTISACPTILGIESTTLQISIFSIATVLEGHMWNVANALNGIFLPRISNLSLKETSIEEINELLIRVGRIQFIIMGVLLSGFFLVGRSFLILWMGDEFITSYFVALLILSPGIITYTEAIGETMLSVMNEIRWRAILFIGSAIIGCFLSFLLASRYGAIGCGIGMLSSLLLCKVIGMNIVYEKILNLDILRFFRECHLRLIWPLLIVVTIFSIGLHYYPINTWIQLVGIILLYLVSYCLAIWFWGMNSYEKALISSLLRVASKHIKL